MKTIIIAYDGSEGAEAIFNELQHAGLPSQVDAHVIAVAKGWSVPDLAGNVPISALPVTKPSGLTGRGEATSEMKAIAEQGAERLREIFPEWSVAAAGLVGSAAQVIVKRASEVSADGIFIGSHSRSAVGRFFLGSVSQKVATEAKCSVHICRTRQLSGAAPRLLVAVDGSRSAQAAASAVAARTWPAGTAVAVVNVIEPPLRKGLDSFPPEIADEIRRQHAARLVWLDSMSSAALRILAPAELASERHSLDGEPKTTLLDWAENWKADCLFIGATGLNDADDTLGTVASALAVRAHCSVEIVRP